MQARLQNEFIEQEISTPTFISDMPFPFCISQCIIQQKNKYLLRVRRDTMLYVLTAVVESSDN